ncbi:hypothetical protein BJX96DRAFT_178526 [Aspergillus floccosus]
MAVTNPIPSQSPLPVSLPNGLGQNGGCVDLDHLDRLRPSPSSLPLDEMRRRLQEDGYLFVKGLIPREDVLDARENYFKAYADTSLLAPNTSPRDGIFNPASHADLHKGIGGNGLPADPVEAQILIDTHKDPQYRAFVEHPVLTKFIRDLMGWKEHVILDRTMLRHNVPFGMGTGIHYDKLFLRGGSGFFLTAWVPIGDISIKGGGLCYLANSVPLGEAIEQDFTARAVHMTPEDRTSAFNANMMAGGMLSQSPQDFASVHSQYGTHTWLVTDYEAGDVVFHNPYSIHASGRNEDEEGRIRLSDGVQPKCGRCQKSGRDCVWSPPQAPQLQFLNSTNAEYSDGQSSGRPDQGTTTFEYVDETPSLAARYTHDACLSHPQPSEVAQGPSLRYPRQLGHTPEDRTVSRQNTGNSEASVLGPSPSGSRLGFTACHTNPISERHFMLPQLALEEACLLRYFVEDLAKWFDLCDPERHFAVVVPKRARSCPPLLDAILSASARYFSTLPRHKQFEHTVKYGLHQGLVVSEETPLRYHSRCISHLRSLSKESDAIMDENLLAAFVILRFYEELDSPFIDPPSETALRGLQVFIEAQAASALSSAGLRQAAFWVGFRQEFHLAFFQQRPFNLPLDIYDSYRLWKTAPDHVWVNHLLIICAMAIQYCYDSSRNTPRYEEIVARRSQWLKCCPPSFSPVYFEAADQAAGELFPKMWYLDDCHIVAVQNVGLMDILLTAYSPQTAHLSPGHTLALSSIDVSIKTTVLEICGAGLSNRQSPTALLTASIAIAICGERFTNHAEQQALMSILVSMSQDNNYWPSQAMQERLKHDSKTAQNE